MEQNFEKWIQNYNELKRIAIENNLRIAIDVKKRKNDLLYFRKGIC